MAKTTVNLQCRISWWVRPYIWAVSIFLQSVAPFLNPVGDGAQSFIDKQIEFITKRGVRFVVNN